jgi:hypothetical protein
VTQPSGSFFLFFFAEKLNQQYRYSTYFFQQTGTKSKSLLPTGGKKPRKRLNKNEEALKKNEKGDGHRKPRIVLPYHLHT